MEKESSNRWIYTCISVDLLNQELSLVLSWNKIVFSHKLETYQNKVLKNVKKLTIWWENKYLGFMFPEKLTLLNIHSNNRSLDTFECGEPGDIYAWKVEGWNREDKEQNIATSIESTYQICQSKFQAYALPLRTFNDALKTCEELNGNMYYEDKGFQEHMAVERKRNPSTRPFWIPYKDENGKDIFSHVYTGSSFINITENFAPGEPNGGRTPNCLKWASDGLSDASCSQAGYLSFCKIPKTEPYLVLRGLCPESQIEKFYTLGNNAGQFIWKGNRWASIQFNDDQWCIFNVVKKAWAETGASHNSLTLGTNEWTIHNDKSCFNKAYIANLSLRLVNILSFNFLLIN